MYLAIAINHEVGCTWSMHTTCIDPKLVAEFFEVDRKLVIPDTILLIGPSESKPMIVHHWVLDEDYPASIWGFAFNKGGVK